MRLQLLQNVTSRLQLDRHCRRRGRKCLSSFLESLLLLPKKCNAHTDSGRHPPSFLAPLFYRLTFFETANLRSVRVSFLPLPPPAFGARLCAFFDDEPKLPLCLCLLQIPDGFIASIFPYPSFCFWSVHNQKPPPLAPTPSFFSAATSPIHAGYIQRMPFLPLTKTLPLSTPLPSPPLLAQKTLGNDLQKMPSFQPSPPFLRCTISFEN